MLIADEKLGREEILRLLQTDVYSEEYEHLLAASREYARRTFGRGYVFCQIGLDSAPCPGNCTFCSMAKDHFVVEKRFTRSAEEAVAEVKKAFTPAVSDLFLMTTECYDRAAFLQVVERVRGMLPKQTRLVVNTGDFDLTYAKKLRESGATGAYHIVRLREGKDTDIPPQRREKTLQAIADSGLDLYYCVEPIGKEHTYEEIADEILRAQRLQVKYMAVMRRVGVRGTRKENAGEISPREIAKIAAVSMLAVRPAISMNVHEVEPVAMAAGINQLYAEYGVNPRDCAAETSKNRGYSVQGCLELLAENGWEVPCV